MDINKTDAADDLLRVAKILADLGCLSATDGNFSVRLNHQRVLLTAAGVEKRALTANHLLDIELADNTPIGGSSEWKMHREIYLNRSDVRCILHAHAPYLTAYAVTQRIPNMALLAESLLLKSEICLVPYKVPGTQALGSAVIKASKTADIYLLSNHGVVAVGKSVTEALHRFERAEFLARTELLANLLGKPIQIPDTDNSF